MSASETAKKLQQKFARLGKPPAPSAMVGNLERAEPITPPKPNEPSVQLNLRVPDSVKHRVRVLAVRDRLSQSELIMRAIALYEDKHGSAPEI
jgi:Ribbon-helix-helix protein, copG family